MANSKGLGLTPGEHPQATQGLAHSRASTQTTQGLSHSRASTQVAAVPGDFTPYTRGGTWPPPPPGGRMPLEQRAKIFIPFEPLTGFNAAIRKKERELEAAHPDMHPLG